MADTHGVTYITPAEHVGVARVEDGRLDIGGVKVPWRHNDAHVYVRRRSTDLSVIEIHMAQHDGLAQEELDASQDTDHVCGPDCLFPDD